MALKANVPFVSVGRVVTRWEWRPKWLFLSFFFFVQAVKRRSEMSGGVNTRESLTGSSRQTSRQNSTARRWVTLGS
eukprot:scaffold292556_cov19-Tisochrysis_lutea.AAC.1